MFGSWVIGYYSQTRRVLVNMFTVFMSQRLNSLLIFVLLQWSSHDCDDYVGATQASVKKLAPNTLKVPNGKIPV